MDQTSLFISFLPKYHTVARPFDILGWNFSIFLCEESCKLPAIQIMRIH